jgi:actin-related protein
LIDLNAEHPLCLILPAYMIVSQQVRRRLATSVLSLLNMPYLRFVDSPSAIAIAHGVEKGVVLQFELEATWVTPVVNGSAVISCTTKCDVPGFRHEVDSSIADTAGFAAFLTKVI